MATDHHPLPADPRPDLARISRKGAGLRPMHLAMLVSSVAVSLAVSQSACVLRDDGSGPAGTGASGPASGPGGGATTGANGGGGGEDGPPVWAAEEPGDPAQGYDLPSWLTFQSPSTDRTTQIGTHGLVLGFRPDVPRPRNVGTGWGLAVEGERKNYVTGSNAWGDAGWQPGTMTRTPGAADPAGGSEAARFQSSGTDFSHFHPIANLVPATGSTWASGEGVATLYSRFITYGPSVSAMAPLETSEWVRLDCTAMSLERIGFFSMSVGQLEAVGQPTNFFAFGAQLEAPALYPSSYIVSGAMAATRLAETLSASASHVAPQGWFDVTLVVAPHYAAGEPLADHDLVYFNADNRLYVRPDGSFVLLAGGGELASPPLAWARNTVLTIVARNTEELRFLSVSGAEPPFETSGGPGDKVDPTTERVYLLGGPTGAQEGADLQSIEFVR